LLLYNATFNGNRVQGALNIDYDESTDLGKSQGIESNGRTRYYNRMVQYLESHPECNVVMWSWCSISSGQIERYLDNFEALINDPDYQDVTFVFMSGYADGYDNVRQKSEQIVAFCKERGYFCLDYWNQDTHDYDNNTFDPTINANNNTRNGNWMRAFSRQEGEVWFQCRHYRTGETKYPAHCDSQRDHLTGNIRAYAAWWLFSRIAGWDGTLTD